MNVGSALHIKLVQVEPDLWALGSMLNSYPFRVDPISSVQRNAKEFYNSYYPSPQNKWMKHEEKKQMEKFVRTVGFVCICKQKEAICQSLDCLIKYLYTAEEMVRNALLAQISFHLSFGISLSYFFTPSFWLSGFLSGLSMETISISSYEWVETLF